MGIKIKKRHLVTKHNDLVEARYRLSLQEQRLIAFMTAEISTQDEDFKPYRFQVKDFAELLGLPLERYYSALKEVVRRLLTRTLTIKKENSKLHINWISSAEYFENEGYIELCFDPKLKPYLLQLKKCFTQYGLEEILKLRSKYAFRLYELCKKNQKLGKYTYEVEHIREMLGVKNNELKMWKDFRKWALEKAIKEINQKTDITISYDVKKQGRKVKWVILNIQKKEIKKQEQKNTLFLGLLNFIPEKYKNLKTISDAISRAYKKHGFDYCKRNILYANKKATENYRVFLIKALQNDWGKDFEDELILEQKRIEEEKKRKIEEQKQWEENQKNLERNAKYARIWKRMSDEERRKYNNSFLEFRVKYKL